MISFTPATFTDELQGFLADIPRNLQYLTAVVDMVVPFDYNGVEFILKVSTPGTPVYINISRPNHTDIPTQNLATDITILPKEEVTSVRIPLSSGVNKIQVTSSLGNVFLRIGVANWATWLYVTGKQINENVLVRLQTREDAILSRTGSLLVERWFSGRDLLPLSNAFHRLGMRLVVDGFHNASRQRSVERVAGALTGNNPVIIRTNNDPIFHPIHSPRYSIPQEFAGNEFHTWFLDLCTMAFVTAGRYIENFPNLWEGIRWQESSIGYKVVETGETHVLLNAEGESGCSVEELLLTEGCFDRIRPWVRITKNKSFIICWSYPFDTSVEVCYALGAVYWDCDTLTMEQLIEDPDYVTPEDPTGDGWVGQALDGRFDYPYGGSFDTFGAVSSFLENECPYERGPVVTPLMITRTDVQIDVDIEVTGTLDTGLGAFGPIYQPV